VPEEFDPENGDGGRLMRPADFTHTNRLDSRELGDFHGVSDFSSLGMRYRETDVTRSVAFPDEDYFVVFDRMRALEEHEYGFNLVGRGTQTVLTETPQMMAVGWEHGGEQAIEHLVSTHDMSLDTSSIWMHDTFDEFEVTQRMTATVQASDASFLSVIETAGAGSPSRFDIARLASSQEHLGLEVRDAAAGWTDTVLAQWTEIERTVGPLTSDAPYAYVREVGGELTSSLIVDGKSLWYENEHILQTSESVTLSMLYEDNQLFGTLSDDELIAGTELDLYGLNIISATLDGVPLAFSNQTGYGQLLLTEGGSLAISVFSVPEPSSGLTLALEGVGATLLWRRRRRSRRS
jgi:hypothetical protein